MPVHDGWMVNTVEIAKTLYLDGHTEKSDLSYQPTKFDKLKFVNVDMTDAWCLL